MTLRLLLPCLLLAATVALLPAADSVIIEPPARTSFTEKDPAYLYFKKIEITPRDSGSYDVTITLLGDIPNSLPKDRGMDLTMSFDFAELAPEKSTPSSRIPNFNADLSIYFTRGINKTKFEAPDRTIEYRKRSFDIKVHNFLVKKDTISFTLRSPLFALHPASTVSFRINNMRATSPTQGSGYITQETAPVSPDLPGAGSAAGNVSASPSPATTAPVAGAIVIEPPAPAAYDDERPAFLFYKKIVVTPRPDAYEVAITLQDNFPSALPPERHSTFAMRFDFADLNPEQTKPGNFTPNFHADYSILLSRDNDIATFIPIAEPFKYRDREWKFEFTSLAARGDTITFTIRSPLFALHPPFTVSFQSQYSKGNSGRFLQGTAPVPLDVSASGSTPAK